jgi:hypothetical protein
MSNSFRRTAAGVGLVLGLALSATPAAHAANTRPSARVVRTASHPAGHGLLTALWSYVIGSNPFIPKPTQGPTVDPNGIS